MCPFGEFPGFGGGGAGTGSSLVPIGTVIPFAGSAAPAGYAICDGSAVSRTNFAALFSTIGTAFGAGDGSTTFNLPDMRDRFPIGQHTVLPLAGTGGSQSITAANMPTHSHTINDPQHNHAAQPGFAVIVQTSSTQTLQAGGAGTQASSNVGNPNTDTKSTGITGTNNAGNGTAYLPPAIGLNFIIRII